jgi:hypothetical protein
LIDFDIGGGSPETSWVVETLALVNHAEGQSADGLVLVSSR